MAHQLTLLLPDDTDFPDPDTALVEPNGLLSVGAALTPAWLLRAYRKGIFPWFDQDDRMPLWWSPDPRAVLLPSELRISRSLGKKIRRKDFRITFDQHFSEVIEACSEPRRGDSGTWITEQMKHAYVELHELGYAHSVEAWQGGLLVGGLYGISLGRMFFGESMFSRVSDASKAALAALVRQLQAWHFSLIDCQIMNDHLASMGAIEMSRREFLVLVAQNNECADRLAPWQNEGEGNV